MPSAAIWTAGHPTNNGLMAVIAIWIAGTIGPVLSSIHYTRETMPGAQYYDGKKLNIPITTEAGLELMERWAHQGISSIMSSMANQHLEKLNEYERNRVYKCSKAAQDIYMQARCVVKVLDITSNRSKSVKPSHMIKLQKLLDARQKETIGALVQQDELEQSGTLTNEMRQVEFRTRRSVTNRYSIKLHTEYEHLTPFGILGKYLSRMTKIFKNKDPKMTWEAAMNSIENVERRVKAKQRFGDELKKRFLVSQDFKSLEPKLTPEEKLLAKELRIPENVLADMSEGERKSSKKVLEIIGLFQRAVKLAMVLNGANGTELENKTLKFASPRLMSLVPANVQNDINILSPSLFSMHNRGKGLEALTSIPRLLKTAENKDYQEWLNFIVEASGATDAIDKMEEAEMLPPGIETMPRGIDGQPMYFSRDNLTEIDPESARKLDIFRKLTRSLTPKQVVEFNRTGFSVMTPEQLMMVYGPDSPFNDTKSLELFLSLNEDDVRRHVLQNIRDIAKIRSPLKIRRKRQAAVLAPVVLTAFVFNPGAVSAPIILSPILLTIILFSPAIFGALIVSPWLFVAIIFAPRLLSPVILSPTALSTIVLSPLVMDPLILSPVAMVPFVMSPLVLSPNILSPMVMAPAILSPFALNPWIFSPLALTAVVASPFILTPFIWSPAYIAVLIFSPNALSPLINSTGKGVTLLFSPSFLS